MSGKKIFAGVCVFIIIFILPLFLVHQMWFGQKNEIKDLSEDDIQMIKETYEDVYNLKLNDTDEIISIIYMAKGFDYFFVLKIKTASPDEFCTNNEEQFPRQEELWEVPFLFSSSAYAPLGGRASIYYTKEYVYISSWDYDNKGISDLYDEIKNNQ